MKGKKIRFKFKDVLSKNDYYNLNTFTRYINKEEIIIENSEIIIKKIKMKVKFIKPLKQEKFLMENFVTMDLETREIDGYL
jgi:hypothetical protein